MKTLCKTPIATAALLALSATSAFAQPVPTALPILKPGGAVINAKVGAPAGNTLAITQNPSANNRALVEWQSFSIGAQSRVQIAQPNAQSVLVNRVTGDGKSGPSASEIYGAMQANGRVFLVNPAGIVFGPGAQVNTGALVATTLDVTDSMSADNYKRLIDGNEIDLVQTSGGGKLASLQVMQAADAKLPQIQVGEGGSIVLLSSDQVQHSGAIAAPGGLVHLGSAGQAQVLPAGKSGFVELALVQPPKGSAGVAITGSVSADSSTGNGGSIRIDGGDTGSVRLTQGALISASSAAPGGTGGEINVMGADIAMRANTKEIPTVRADGSAGGGRIAMGDTRTRSLLLDEGTLVSADATIAGNGGTIILRAMHDNTGSILPTAPIARVDYGVGEFYGQIRARGGANGGDGGWVETSGTALTTSLTDAATGVRKSAHVDARSLAGGKPGTWSLDPFDVSISNNPSVGVNGSFNPTGAGANVQADDITAALDAGTSVDISTAGAGNAAGNISVEPGVTISRSSGTAATSLTLRAHNNITGSGFVIDASKGGPLNVTLQSDLDASGAGHVNLVNATVNTGGGNLLIGGGTNPATGFARGDSQNAGVGLAGGSFDLRGNIVNTVGDMTVRGQGGAGSTSPGVNLGASIWARNLVVDGRASSGNAVTLNGGVFDVDTSMAVRGIGTRTDINAPAITGIDTGTASINLRNTGSLLLAGRGDDAGFAPSLAAARGLVIGDLRISAGAASTASITLAGQATGGSTGAGVFASPGGNSGLVINSDAGGLGSPATGANVVIGGLSDSQPASLVMAGIGPRISTTGSVNIRPLGVDAQGALTEQTAVPIAILAPGTSAPGFNVEGALFATPNATTRGIGASSGVVIGSAAHTGAITLGTAAVSNTGLSLSLQNEGAGSQGITVGNGNNLNALGLLTAGNVTQSGGGFTAQTLVVRGGANSNVDLSNAANQIGTLAFDPPATLNVRTLGNLTLDAAGVNSFGGGSFAPLAITDSLGGNAATLRAAGNVQLNRSITMTGGSAPQLDIVSDAANGSITFAPGATLSAANGGRWQLWAASVVNAPVSGARTNLYGCVFGDTATCSLSGAAISPSGNQVLNPTRPTLTVSANPTTYSGGGIPPTPGLAITGLANGDTAAQALSGAAVIQPNAASPTGYRSAAGTLASPLGYNLVFTPGDIGFTRVPLDFAGTRGLLQTGFGSEVASDVYGSNLDRPFICTAASVMRGGLDLGAQGDPLASEWGKVRGQPQLSGCLNVTDGGQCSAF